MSLSGGRTLSIVIFAAALFVSAATVLEASGGAFIPTGSMGSPRSGHTATLLPNGTVLVAGGNSGTNSGAQATAEIYNPVTGTFSPTGSMLGARAFHTATLLSNGTVLIAGGYTGVELASAEIYNPVTGTFSPTGSMGIARHAHTATLLKNGTVLVAGGYNGGSRASAEVYDPVSGSFSSTANMAVTRTHHTASLLADGTVLVAGGSSFPGPHASAEIYHPATGTFTLTGSMATPRYEHAGVLLADGRVLVAGGFRDSAYLTSAELYNPSTGTFSSTGSMAFPRYDLQMGTLLSNGRVLVAGGWLGGPQSVAEVYDPATGTFSSAGNMTTARVQHTVTSLGNGTALVAGSFGQRSAELFVSPSVSPPTASAGADFSVDEGQASVALDGSASHDPDGDTLTYSWVQLPGGSTVTLFDATTAHPTFSAPFVAPGGETLTFELTVTANGETDDDTVSITVVNVNHTPVADAGDDQAIAEGSSVTLNGTSSFDADNDPISYSWVQMSGPAVILTDAHTTAPSFTAPVVGTGGAPGVVATLVFKLTVDDGFPHDAPAPGYSLANVEDTVTIQVTNVNNAPTADASTDQTLNESAAASLNGTGSNDPDGDTLSYAWAQIGGPVAALTGATTAIPTLTTPFVGPGGADLTFRLTVDDGYGGTATDTVVIHVQNANDPPLVSAAQPTIACLWPPNHLLVSVGITGVSDPEDNATITINSITQDEPTQGLGDGDTAVDAVINGDGTVLLRAERSGNGNGRVYHVHFTASDLEGSATGAVTVCVPHQRKSITVDDGDVYDSTN